ncbi:ribulose phosphate epimerase [Mycoplasmopsis ciconiae]|uniref:Ribulose phosphate epimerase n=1 Tax=Mycoplasmopsis ciconiae TaxID=561067 RepID=A0ABU7MM06_9BACT|nr:ribulose phosphate epimerase [Mycoplasmopsis ciconiae]
MKYSQSVAALNLFEDKNKLDFLVQSGLRYMHLDFSDFKYTHSFSLTISQVDYLIATYPQMIYDAHLMCEEHAKIVEVLASRKIAYIATPLKNTSISLLKEYKQKYPQKFGLMLEKDDDLLKNKEIIKLCDYVVLMTIDKIGGTGVELNKDLLKRSALVREINPNIIIYSDGGLRLKNAHEFKEHNFDVAVGGSIVNDFYNKNINFIEYWKENFE